VYGKDRKPVGIHVMEVLIALGSRPRVPPAPFSRKNAFSFGSLCANFYLKVLSASWGAKERLRGKEGPWGEPKRPRTGKNLLRNWGSEDRDF